MTNRRIKRGMRAVGFGMTDLGGQPATTKILLDAGESGDDQAVLYRPRCSGRGRQVPSGPGMWHLLASVHDEIEARARRQRWPVSA